MSLKIDWATHKAAEYACKNWHYSKCIPFGKLVKFGIWENNIFIGCVLFGRGAAPKLASSWGLKQTEIAELVRIALNKHNSTVTKIMSVCIKLFKKQFPNIKLLVSFADTSQNHNGTIYQAGNWHYYGKSDQTGGYEYKINNKWITCRSIGMKYGTRVTSEIEKQIVFTEKRRAPLKHRYVYPLNNEMIEIIKKKEKPYPKKCAGSKASVASSFQLEEGCATQTPALHIISNSEEPFPIPTDQTEPQNPQE